MRNKHPLRAAQADLRRLLRHADVLELSVGARLRLRWFAYALAHGGNVSLTCRHFGISRSTFFRWADRFDPKRPETLEEYSRRPHTVRKPESDERIVTLIRGYREVQQPCSKERIAELLAAEHGLTVSASTVGRIIRRHGFFFSATPSHAEKRGGTVADVPTQQLPMEHPAQDHGDEPFAEGGRAAAPAGAAVLLLASVAALHPREAHAAESTSYRLMDEFPTQAQGEGDTSPSYRLLGGMTWNERPPLTGATYQVVITPPQATSSSRATSAVQGGAGNGTTETVSQTPQGGRRGAGTTARSAASTAGHPAAPKGTSSRSSLRTSRTSASAAPPDASRQTLSSAGLPRQDAMPAVQYALANLSKRSFDLACAPGHRCFFNSVDLACPAPEVSLLPCTMSPIRAVGGFGPGVFDPAAASALGAMSWFWPFAFTALALVASCVCHARRERRLFALLAAAATTKRAKRKAGVRRSALLTVLLAIGLSMSAAAFPQHAEAVTSAPLQHVYNGHLLTAANAPVTTAVQIRFSYWATSDYQTGDVTAGGAINTGAATYAGWSEVHTLTPNAQGYFSVRLGSGTALPSMSGFTLSDLLSLHLQVEVKPAAAADTSYELLDTNASETIDRSPVLSVPFALNADMLDQRDVGTGSGSIPVLGSGGTIAAAQVPSGTTADRFIIDTNNTETSAVTLQFGATLAKTLSYDIANGYFAFNDDVRIQGDLTVTGLVNGVDITNLQADTGGLLRVASGGGLNVVVTGGTYRLNGELTAFAGQSGVAVAANATNYLFFGSGGLTVRVGAFPADEAHIPLAIVTTNAGAVTGVDDRRPYLSDDREHSEKIVLAAQYPGASYAGDGSNNIGQLSVQKDDALQRNYYRWASTQPTLQDIDLTTRFTLGNDFVRWGSGITLQYRTATADSSQNAIASIAVYDTAGNAVTLMGSSTNLASTTWASTTLTFAGSPTWQPGGEVTVVIRFASKDSHEAHIGALTLGTVRLDRE